MISDAQIFLRATSKSLVAEGWHKTISILRTHKYLNAIVQNLVVWVDTEPRICTSPVIIYYYWYSALGLVWAETGAQSGDWYGSGTLHPGQVLRGSLPLLSPEH